MYTNLKQNKNTKRMFQQWWSTIPVSTNINKTNNHLSPRLNVYHQLILTQ